MRPRTTRGVVFLLAWLAYLPVLPLGFMIDDPFLIHTTSEPAFWNAAFFKQCFTSGLYTHGGGTAYFRPLFNLLLYAEAWFWGMHPLGYHMLSLFFHALNAVLVMELMICLELPLIAATLAGALFAVHPIIIGEMMPAAASGMMALCLMLSSILALNHPKRTVYVAGCVLYLLALLTKESSVVIPLLAGLSLYATRRSAHTYLRLLPLILCLPLYIALLLSSGGLHSHYPLAMYVRFYVHAFPSIALRLASLVIVPWNLMSWRALPEPTRLWPLYWGCFIGLLLFFHQRRVRWAVFSIAWFLVTLSPCLIAITLHNTLMDQWAYPGLVAFLVPVGLLGARALSSHHAWLRHGMRIVYGGAVIVCMAIIAINVARRGSDEKNFKWTFEHFPQADFAKNRFLAVLVHEHRWNEARFYLARFHQQDPSNQDYARFLNIITQAKYAEK